MLEVYNEVKHGLSFDDEEGEEELEEEYDDDANDDDDMYWGDDKLLRTTHFINVIKVLKFTGYLVKVYVLALPWLVY